ncbi:MAG: hypothetical protein ABSH47_01940 [Bryobacteraceae bacterium]|jgi:pimeloyl-ACP methyl ester carboxylesterase
MCHPSAHRARVLVLASLITPAWAQQLTPWHDPCARAAIDAYNAAIAAYVDRWNRNLLSGVGDVHFIDLPGAGHYVYLTREAEVLRGLQAFLESLP